MKQRYSLPSVNWVRFAGGDEDVAEGTYPTVCSLPDALAAAAGAGFDSVGLYDYNLDAHLAEGGHIDDVAALLQRHDLACSSIGTLRADEPNARAAARHRAEIASLTGAGICIAVILGEVTDAAVDELAACAEILADADVRIALEAVPYVGLSTLEAAVGVCDRVGWDRCGLLVDAWHFFTGGQPWGLLGALSAEQIALVHVSDGDHEDGEGELVFRSRFRRRLPGQGSFDLGRLREVIEATGYRGPVEPEVLSTELRLLPPSEAACRLMEATTVAWPLPR